VATLMVVLFIVLSHEMRSPRCRLRWCARSSCMAAEEVGRAAAVLLEWKPTPE